MKNQTSNRRIMGFPDEFWIGFVVMIGIFLKIVYDVSAGYGMTTHMLGEWKALVNDIPNGGQLGLIQYYLTYKRLPNFDPSLIACYRNQPLFYVYAATMLDIFFVNAGWPLGTVLHGIQCINCIFVAVGTFVSVSILGKWGIKGRRKVFALILLMFFPGFYNLGAALDYHALAFMLETLTLNKMLGWYQFRQKKLLIHSAICFGTALMTDLEAMWLAVPVGIIFLCARYYDQRPTDGDFKKNILTYSLIVLPMGWWYPIRNLIRFGTNPFGWDHESAAWQYLGYYPVSSRLGFPSGASLKHLHLSTDTIYHSNIWGQTFKTAVVNESALNLELNSTNFLAQVLLWTIILFFVLSFVMLMINIVSGRLTFDFRILIGCSMGAMLLFYIISCFVHPVISTMNYIRIPMVLLFLLPGYGMMGSRSEKHDRSVEIISMVMEIMIVTISVLAAFLFGFYAV